ncbi:hypothetical protein H2203_007022 [Taxawa tesnikishii (nom. ined.)]|nr:hypothetical protein H2203_007022 [Dothideales sp. JES 119]
MTQYDIQIVSDTVCPWCYVGRARLNLAIKQHQQSHPSDTFTTSWSPFYLNPTAPTPGVDKQTHYEAKFGAQRTRMMQQHLSRLGGQLGINFAFGGKTGNTRDSHRLIQLGKTKGLETQDKVVRALFESYFERNEDITSREVLEEAREWLESGKGGEEVDREVGDAQRRFVSGVPNFTINGRFEIQGAEEPDAFLDAFERIRRDEERKGANKGGKEVLGDAPAC